MPLMPIKNAVCPLCESPVSWDAVRTKLVCSRTGCAGPQVVGLVLHDRERIWLIHNRPQKGMPGLPVLPMTPIATTTDPVVRGSDRVVAVLAFLALVVGVTLALVDRAFLLDILRRFL